MNTTDKVLKTRARKALDAVTRSQTDQWRRNLDAARERALRKTTTAPGPWSLAAAAALVAALALGLMLRPTTPEIEVQPVAEAGLYQDLEFYLWLAQELESESYSASRS